MLVFIDDSGDAGFKIAKGSSPLFVVGMVVFDNIHTAQRASARMDQIGIQFGHRTEFKFATCRNSVRDEFFRQMVAEEFSVRALVVDKELVRSENLKSVSDRFHQHFIRLLLRQGTGVLKDATIVIDGSGGRDFRSGIGTAIRNQMPSGSVAKVRLKDSRSDRLVQLADMCVGAIYRAHRKDDRRNESWLLQIEPGIDNISLLK